MSSLSHTEIWTAIDALAKRFDMSPSAMAKLAGLDPTSFNRSKRGDGDARPRWPSTESLAKVLEATGVGFSEFAALTERAPRPNPRAVPLIGFAQAGAEGLFDETGAPTGPEWDEIDFPGLGEESVYALEITGDALVPVFRDGDRILVSPTVPPRRGDRVVVRTAGGELLIKELARVTARSVELASLNRVDGGDGGDRTLDLAEVVWIARILWASQ
ncbi:DNA-binding protein [Caulobacter sp. Root487D2Y]|uniref:S24 family peptidase n=1 Tax=Caulobacter sp. Root487D2Y TaxID=1736547 RepID=UPI000701787F|nr:helix-turn-helix transcriptional regulator [Caulobacter sp. Root487D2Y]KQY35004.1 DNA-binding protein [Caulobacter sp. Root487D2Y]